MAFLTKAEQSTLQNMKFQLCDILGIKRDPNNCEFLGSYAGSYVRNIINEDPTWTFQTMQKLQAKHGDGACVVAFRSVQDFKEKKPSNIFGSYFPNEFSFGAGSCFITNEFLQRANLYFPDMSDGKGSKHKSMCACAVIVYHKWPKSELFVSFGSSLFDAEGLKPYFERKKWSATVLRKHYPQYLNFFNSKRPGQIFSVMYEVLDLNPRSPKKTVLAMIPSADLIAEYIDDQRDMNEIKMHMKNIKKQCEKKNAGWNQAASFNLLSNKIPWNISMFYDKLPLIQKELNSIVDIIGAKLYSFLFEKQLRHFKPWRKHLDLMRLIAKIEGRKCSFGECRNQESRHNGVMQKYKTCSACRNVFYCSKSCQKRDWVFGNHELHCSPNKKYNLYNLTSSL